MNAKDAIEIFTDGASKGNPGPGGYAAILNFKDYQKKIYAGFRLTTNNRMELMAVIKALELIKRDNIAIVIYTDSKYIVDAINKKWMFSWRNKNWNNANPDLWQILYNLYNKFDNIRFVWIKGHSGNPKNEECDTLAVSAASKAPLLIDEFYEKLKHRKYN